MPSPIPALCRDCLALLPPAPRHPPRCPHCRSPRLLAHAELTGLNIAHVDCDAFYASVEKRDHPELAHRALIIGGGQRGVVSTCCYIARIRGVRSAMPMFEARRLCPDAVILPPDMERYAAVSREIRARMLALTPAVEPLSLDEAFLDLTGTGRLHGAPPAVLMARLCRDVERDLGITMSVGLSHNRFLAKTASDLDKPRGFSIIGQAETMDFLGPKPIRFIWGVGLSSQAALEAVGIRTIADLREWDMRDLVERFGQMGERLWHLARGQDSRPIRPDEAPKSISKETTFDTDTSDPELLRAHLWRLAEQVADRAKARGFEGRTAIFKVKTSDHQILTRRRALGEPAQIADVIWRVTAPMLDQLLARGPFRLIGCGITDLAPASGRDPRGDLLDPDAGRRAAAERATDAIRARFGRDAIMKGRSLATREKAPGDHSAEGRDPASG